MADCRLLLQGMGLDPAALPAQNDKDAWVCSLFSSLSLYLAKTSLPPHNSLRTRFDSARKLNGMLSLQVRLAPSPWARLL